MTNKHYLSSEQANTLKDIEKIIGKSISTVDIINYHTVGVKIEGKNIVGLGLNSQLLYKPLPEIITRLTSLEVLGVRANKLATLPESIGTLSSLKTLYLVENQLTTLPESIGNLKSLEKLDLYRNMLRTLPESIGDLTSLKELNLKNNQLTTLPESIGNLSSLQTLTLMSNHLKTLPESIGNLSSLQALNLHGNGLSTLPESIGNLSSLKVLKLSFNHLTTLPESIEKLKSLEVLGLESSRLSTLPESIGNLTSLKELNLKWSKLTTLPEIITKLTSLKILDLGRNQLTTLPESISKLSSLQVLDLGDNRLTNLPESFGNLKLLRTLNLTKNQFATPPESLWRCKNLKSLRLILNPWKKEWKGIDRYDISTILELCRQRASITIFISYSREDKEQYRLINLKENLKGQEEIREVYISEVQKIPESQLMLFIATKNSITDEQCRYELEFALTHYIGIIPIKGTDIKWKDLSSLDMRTDFKLSDKLGLEFDGENFDKFSDDLYDHIKKYKHDINLFEPIERKIDEQWENIKILGEKFVDSDEFREIFKGNITQFKKLSEKLRNKQISPFEYILKCAQILNSASK